MDVVLVDPWMLSRKDEVWAVDIMVGPWMVWGKDEVWVDVIIVLGPGCCGGRMTAGSQGGRYPGFGPWVQRATDEVWVHEIMALAIMALAHGCSEGRMRSGWT